MFYALIALCGILSFMAVRSTFYPLKWVASFSWWGLLTYWLTSPPLTQGTPPDVIIMLLLIMVAILFLLWGMAGRRGTVDVQDEISDTGGITRRTQKYTTTNKEPTQGTESTLEYRKRVRKALSSKRASRRK